MNILAFSDYVQMDICPYCKPDIELDKVQHCRNFYSKEMYKNKNNIMVKTQMQYSKPGV